VGMKKKKIRRGKDQGCPIAKDLRTPKYRKRVVPDKAKVEDKIKCREPVEVPEEAASSPDSD